MNKPNTPPIEINEQAPQTEETTLAVKETFVEPTVSVPTEVLEATTFFQGPTIESSSL